MTSCTGDDLETRKGRGVPLTRFLQPCGFPIVPDQHRPRLCLGVRWGGASSGSYQWVLVIEQPPFLGIDLERSPGNGGQRLRRARCGSDRSPGNREESAGGGTGTEAPGWGAAGGEV